jgi:FAD/FMN-containing dehydrogenase
MSLADLSDEIAAVVGEDACIRDPERQSAFVVDWRNLVRGRTALVALPSTTEQVSAIVRLCASANRPIVPQGGNTSLVGGATPSEEGNEIVVSLGRMNKIRAMDPVADTITVEAGCILRDVQIAADNGGRYFPLSLGAEGSCQVGGNVSTNAGGHAVLRYGNMRELVLGLEVVLATGEVLSKLRGLHKDNTGYDLKQLFVGAEGTLGIVTAATLKLFAQRRQVETALVAFKDLRKLMDLLADVRAHCEEFLSAFELLPRAGIEMALEHVPGVRDPMAKVFPYYALVELSSSQVYVPLRGAMETLLAGMLDRGLIEDAVISASQQQAAELWHLREACVEAQRVAGPSLKHDVSVPLGAVPALIIEASAAIAEAFPEVRIVPFGHVGDGNVHFNVCIGRRQDAGAFMQSAERISGLIYDHVARLDGSFSAEHGIGRMRVDELHKYGHRLDLSMMRAIKATLDPTGLFNPGRIFGTASETGVRAKRRA